MSNFCKYCGAKFSRPNAAFCAACGRAVQADSSLPPASAFNQTRVLGATAQLIVQEPGQIERPVLLSRPLMIVGRDPASDIVTQNPAVSRRHAQIEQRGTEHWLTDLGSTNGTSVNGSKIAASHKLSNGDMIRMGDARGNSVGFIYQAAGAADQPVQTIPLGRLNLQQQATVTMGRDPACQIHLNHPSVSRQHARLEQTPQGAVLRDLNSSNGTFVNGQPVRGDCSLQNGDVIKIGPFKLVYDQAGLTQYTPGGNYRLDALNLKREVKIGGGLSLKNLGRPQAPTRKLILQDVSLSIYPREFVALVGGSGAGKSTLMKALSGFTPADGQVLINGDDLYANFAAYRSILGYVPQDDIIHGHLTVSSALTYAAQLRLPDADPAEVQRRVQEALSQVEMAQHADKQVNQLSGGQRKRVSIAAELLANPGLFFLDEPTSGLDPGLEKKMMYTMRQLADAGRTIVLVTHATANIAQCTHVAFMADGYLVFFGPPQEALAFFDATDFADIYARLGQPIDPVQNSLPPRLQPHYQQLSTAMPNPSTAQVWAACFQASPQYRQYVSGRLQINPPPPGPAAPPQPTKRRGSAIQQFAVLARRYFDLIRRDKMSLFILLAVMPLIGLLLLIMAKPQDLVGKPPDQIREQIQQEIADKRLEQDPTNDDEKFQASYIMVGAAQRLLFMLSLSANLLGIFAAAYEIIKEEAIYARERMVNLKIVPYLLSKMAVLALFAAIQCLLLLLVVRLRVEYPANGVMLPAAIEMYITLFLASLANIAAGLLISALARSQNTVIYVILIVLFVQILFAGAIFDLPDLAKPISYLTTSRWTLEALGDTVNLPERRAASVSCVEFENEQLRRGLSQAESPCINGQIKQTPDFKFNVSYDSTTAHLLTRWAVLMAFALAFGGLTWLVQKRKDVV